MREAEAVSSRLYRWLTYRLYNELAWAYDVISWVISAGQWGRWRALATQKPLGTRVLEIGFGSGHLIPRLIRQGHVVVGLDESAAMHQVTSARLTASGNAVPLVLGKAEHLPFSDAAFDTVVMTFPAGFLLHGETFAECARTTRQSPEPATAHAALVAVGVWVRPIYALLESVPSVFYGKPQEESLDRIRALAAGAGLRAIYQEDRIGPVQVGSLIAYHRDADISSLD